MRVPFALQLRSAKIFSETFLETEVHARYISRLHGKKISSVRAVLKRGLRSETIIRPVRGKKRSHSTPNTPNIRPADNFPARVTRRLRVMNGLPRERDQFLLRAKRDTLSLSLSFGFLTCRWCGLTEMSQRLKNTVV